MNPTTEMKKNMQGWGADLDPKNRPGVPKEGTPPRGTGAHYEYPEQQIPRVKIYKTVERKNITPVFGTSCPPRGVSGLIRDVAYTYSENCLRRWMLLLAADRVDVVEGMISDIFSGKLPHLLKEMGLRSELTNQHKKERFGRDGVALVSATKGLAFIGTFLLGAAFFAFRKQSQKKMSAQQVELA